MSIQENLEKLISERGITANALAKMAGVPQPTVYKILTGKSKNPGIETLTMLAIGLRVPLSAILGEPSNTTLDDSVSPIASKPHARQVPLINWVQAGFFTGIDESREHDFDWYFCPINISEHGFCLCVCGESMEPKFHEGDIVFVDPERHADNGSIVIVVNSEFADGASATMKKLVTDGQTAYLKPLNPDWPGPKYIEFTETMQIKGVVIGKFVEV